MSIVTISRGSYSMGKAVAERVAERMGYECISRDVLLEASEQFDIPEIRLLHAMKDAPSVLERFTHGRQRYVAYIQSALTRRVRAGDAVYHGLAGHVLLRRVSHVLKVRILADSELRLSIVMEREKLTRKAALSWLARLDRERRNWTRSLYGVDPGDPALYDLLLKVPRYEIEDAAELICRSLEMPQFKRTPESGQDMDDLALACQVKAELVAKHPDVAVASRHGNVVVYAPASDRQARKLKAALRSVGERIEGLNNVEVHAGARPPDSAV